MEGNMNSTSNHHQSSMMHPANNNTNVNNVNHNNNPSSRSLEEHFRRHRLLRARTLGTACRLVQDILEQITLNDSPPMNEDVANQPTNSSNNIHSVSATTTAATAITPNNHNSHSVNHSTSTTTTTTTLPSPANGSTAKFSRQQHVVLSTGGSNTTTPTAATAAGHGGVAATATTTAAVSPSSAHLSQTASAESSDPLLPSDLLDNSSNHSLTSHATLLTTATGAIGGGHDQLSLWLKRYHISETRAESKMGHVALATLCARTLESLKYDIPEDNEYDDDNNNNAAEPEQPPQPFITTTKRATSLVLDHHQSSNNNVIATAAPVVVHDESHSAKRRASESAAVWSNKTSHLQIDTRVANNNNKMIGIGPPSSTSASTTDGPLSSKSKSRRDLSKPQRWLSWRNYNKSPSPSSSLQHQQQQEDFVLSSDTLTPKADNLDPSTIPPSFTSSDTIATTTTATPSWNVESTSHEDVYDDTNNLGCSIGSGLFHIETEPEQQQQPVINQETAPLASPRLKMFGSEYARFLSSTALAPSITPTNSHHYSSSGLKANFHHHPSSLLPRRPSRVGGSVTRAALNQLNTGHRLEDANIAVLTGAITDILITYGDELPPKGYFRITQTGQGDEFKAMVRRTSGSGNAGGGGSNNKSDPMRWTLKQQQQVYINVKKEANWDRAAQRPCVTALAVIFPDRKEFVPPGFCVVNRYVSNGNSNSNGNSKSSSDGNGKKRLTTSRSRTSRHASNTLSSSEGSGGNSSKNVPANLNFGSTAGERVYLCFRRSREGNPITGIIPLQPSNHDPIPEGYTVLERTPRNFVADINAKSGSPVFLAFRQRLANLEPLRPLPLVLSVHSADPFGAVGAAAESKSRSKTVSTAPFDHRRKRLHAYYCTGGTVVVSDVGRFHIMDRSTHSLLSPSSIANRMSLIELSRRRTTMQQQQQQQKQQKQPRAVAMYASSSSNSKSQLRKSSNDSLLSSTFRAAHRLSMGNGSGGDDVSCQMSITSGASLMNASYVSEMGMSGDASVTDSIASSLASSMASSTDIMLYHNSHVREGFVRDNIALLGDSIAEHAVTASSSSDNEDNNNNHNNPTMTTSTNEALQGEQPQHRPSMGGASSLQFLPEEDELELCLEALDFIPTIEPADEGDDKAETMLFLQQRAALLTPILTACYSRHGGSALIAVEGLTKLLKTADFFRMDVGGEHCMSSTSRLTLLDITVQTVCDVATTGAQETSFSTCVEFVEAAVRYSRGQLNTRTTGYVLRFYLFVFYFGASVPTSANWPNSVWGQSLSGSGETGAIAAAVVGKELKMDDDMPMLFDPRDGNSTQYLPGGAPQAAALALKELITRVVAQLRHAIATAEAASSKTTSRQSIKSFVEGILTTLVDKAVHQVDIANYTQLAMHQVHRSGGSELFWHDMMNACGAGLFDVDDSFYEGGRDIFIVSFAVLAYLVKVCSGKLRRVSQTGQLMPRDVASKILSLELLLHFLEQWGDGQQAMADPPLRSLETLLFCVRRLVVPCLLSNTKPGLEDARIFRRLIRIASALLCSPIYRKHMKAEIGVLMEHFALRMLQLGPQLLPLNRLEPNGRNNSSSLVDDLSPSLLPQQVELVIAIKRWFSGPPTDIVELYLNFDTNIEGQVNGPIQIMPGTQWKICQQLCALLCSIAEQCGEILGEQVRHSHLPGTSPLPRAVASFGEFYDHGGNAGNGQAEMSSLRENARLLRRVTLEAIAQVVKSLAHSAAKACGKSFHRLLSVWSSFNPPEIDDISSLKSFSLEERSTSTVSSMESKNSHSREPGVTENGVGSESTGIIDYWQTAIVSNRATATGETDVGQSRKSEPALAASTKPRATRTKKQPKMNSSRSLKALHGPAHANDLTIEPLEVAFQIAHDKSLKRAVDYLVACNVLSPAPRDIASFLRIHKARLNPSILGDYLGEGGNDGAEAEYWNLIRFSYVRAISFAGMTVEQGLRNFLTNGGFRLPGEAQSIDRIMTTFSQCYWEDNAGDLPRCPFHDQDTVFLISFAIIMLNTDLHKTGKTTSRKRKKMTKTEFLNNLRGVDHLEEMTRDYLSSIFDSVEANPIILVDDVQPCGNFRLSAIRGVQHYDVATLLTAMLNSVKTSDALLRGLSVHEHEFFEVKDFSNSFEYGESEALADLTRGCVATTWHHFHGVINAALETAHLDPEGMESCIEVLGYALCVTIALDMKMERVAFLNQLARFKLFKDRRQGQWLSSVGQEGYENEALYTRIEKLCGDDAQESEKRRLNAMVLLNRAIRDLHSSFAVDAHVKKDMKRIVSRIRDGEYLLNDPSRRFLRDGDLLKKSNRSGRFVEYRFFLFSDMLVYSKFSTVSNDYKIHEELPLHLMKITDWFPPDTNKKMGQQTKRMFQIHHPNKSFLVVAGSSDERKSWVSDIRSAIDEEVRRKAQLEAARVAASSATVGH